MVGHVHGQDRSVSAHRHRDFHVLSSLGNSSRHGGEGNHGESSQGAQGWSSELSGLRRSLGYGQTLDNPSRGGASMIGDGLGAPSHALDSTSSGLDGSAGGSRLLIIAQRKGGLPHVVSGLGNY